MTLTASDQKNRVWKIFSDPSICTWDNSDSSQCLQWENTPVTTISASGANYYGFRYYSPHLGRWLNREPIGELGPDGPNLYAFVHNQVFDFFDYLGLMGRVPKKPEGPPPGDPNKDGSGDTRNTNLGGNSTPGYLPGYKSTTACDDGSSEGTVKQSGEPYNYTCSDGCKTTCVDYDICQGTQVTINMSSNSAFGSQEPYTITIHLWVYHNTKCDPECK